MQHPQQKICIECNHPKFLWQYSKRSNGEHRSKCNDCLFGRKPDPLPASSILFIDGSPPPAALAPSAPPKIKQHKAADMDGEHREKRARRVSKEPKPPKPPKEPKPPKPPKEPKPPKPPKQPKPPKEPKPKKEKPTPPLGMLYCVPCATFHPEADFYPSKPTVCKARHDAGRNQRYQNRIAAKRAKLPPQVETPNAPRLTHDGEIDRRYTKTTVHGEEKTCGRCHKDKPLSDFRQNKRNPRLYASYCKECQLEYNREITEKKKQKQSITTPPHATNE